MSVSNRFRYRRCLSMLLSLCRVDQKEQVCRPRPVQKNDFPVIHSRINVKPPLSSPFNWSPPSTFKTISDKRLIGLVEKQGVDYDSAKHEDKNEHLIIAAKIIVMRRRVASKNFAKEILKFLFFISLALEDYKTKLLNSSSWENYTKNRAGHTSLGFDLAAKAICSISSVSDIEHYHFNLKIQKLSNGGSAS